MRILLNSFFKTLTLFGLPFGIFANSDIDTGTLPKLEIPGLPAEKATFYTSQDNLVDGVLKFDMVQDGKVTANIKYLYQWGRITHVLVSGDSKLSGLYSIETVKTANGDLPRDYSITTNGRLLRLFGGYKKMTDKDEISAINEKMNQAFLSKPEELTFNHAVRASASKQANIRGAELGETDTNWNKAVLITSAFESKVRALNNKAKEKDQATNLGKDVEMIFGKLRATEQRISIEGDAARNFRSVGNTSDDIKVQQTTQDPADLLQPKVAN